MKKLSFQFFGKPTKEREYIYQRFLVLCDLHFLEEGQLDAISSLDCDCCLLLGDIPSDALFRIKELVMKPIYAVGGNHDTREMYEKANISYVHGELVEVNGFSVTGLEGSHRYKKAEELLMLTQEESIKAASELPPADILISHDSSFGRYGEAPNKCGLKGISNYIKKHRPKLHLHGHYHIYDKYRIGKTSCIACYRCMIIDTNGDTEVIF